MVLVFVEKNTARLQYSCSFIFNELLNVSVEITNDQDKFNLHPAVKINYSCHNLSSSFQITPIGLLFETGIADQQIECFKVGTNSAFFKTTQGDFSFDIFAATFYLLSRYEEYLPHTKDIYGRYAHKNSLAFKEGFLQLPLINIWVNDLINAIQHKFLAFNFQPSTFSFLPTYDIDMAYSYKYKGFIRKVGGFFKKPSIERLKVLTGKAKDPFDVYEWLDNFHHRNNLQPIYFFLLAQKNSQYDKNILPNKNAMQELIKIHAKKYAIGIHPSWQSGDDFSILEKEKALLESVCEQSIHQSRQHYIRFTLPDTYRQLSKAGITADYSMGYGSINGFRASVASSFYWYDVEKEEQTNLRIHPFCFMDANSFYEQNLSPTQALDELLHYLNICKTVNGQLITIWHNNFLGTAKEFAGWKEVYEVFMAHALE